MAWEQGAAVAVAAKHHHLSCRPAALRPGGHDVRERSPKTLRRITCRDDRDARRLRQSRTERPADLLRVALNKGAGRPENVRAVAEGLPEDALADVPEKGAAAAHEPDVGPGEAVDRLPVVTDEEEGDATWVPVQCLEQSHAIAGDVLELVDQHVAVVSLLFSPRQHIGCPRDQVVEVHLSASRRRRRYRLRTSAQDRHEAPGPLARCPIMQPAPPDGIGRTGCCDVVKRHPEELRQSGDLCLGQPTHGLALRDRHEVHPRRRQPLTQAIQQHAPAMLPAVALDQLCLVLRMDRALPGHAIGVSAPAGWCLTPAR